MFHDNDNQLVVNLEYQMDKKELALMITKTLFTRCYAIICDLRFGHFATQYNALYYCFEKSFTSPKILKTNKLTS